MATYPRLPPVFRTRLTELLGIDHPVMAAGMGGVALAELTAAVTNAGGIGCIGAATFFFDLEKYRAELKRVKELTTGPWGVDILASDLAPALLSTMVDILIEEGARMFVTGRGTSKEMVARCHHAGVKVGCVAGQVQHALKAVEYGYDFVIVQGQEGGGHTGEVSLMPLLPQVIDAVGRVVPVVAAGGIYDSRGLAAALAMGADGVWMGTRFLASHEARTVPGYKERMLQTTSRDTQITAAYTGKPCRVIRNKWVADLPSRLNDGQLTEKELYETIESDEYLRINHIMGVEFNTQPLNLDIEFMPCGQVVGAIRSIEPAHKILNDVVLGAVAQLDRVQRARL